MFKIILIALAVLPVILLIYAASRPKSFRVERSISVKAPAEKIFPLINELQHWESWSPWEKVDPALKRNYSGPASGKGATYEWFGNKEIGQGRMEITDSTPASRVLIKIDFLVPFEAHNTVEFKLEPQGDTTLVSHAMFGPSPYMARLMGIFFNMDKMIGQKFEEGLANLKGVAEAA
jgi:hypothetical protein